MSNVFRDLLRKVGSGSHTSENLTRGEAETATRLMLLQEATPAQIGAFMIAHRIRRPSADELAGMLDAYDQLGPRLDPVTGDYPPLILGIPYDGRSRTAPISPLTTLILASVRCPVVLHGGRRMPTKEGVPLVELWQGLGVDWSPLSLPQVQQVLAQTYVGLVYLPTHFPLADDLVPYREQIGKRPPFATMELFWCPYEGAAKVVSGFVHPPTEELAHAVFAMRGVQQAVTVKGLEGSCDLPRDRTCIIGLHYFGQEPSFERVLLHPRDYGFAATEVPLLPTPELVAAMQAVLQGEPGELMEAAVWNGGFYLWQCGHCADLEAGFVTARQILTSGKAAQTLADLQAAVKTGSERSAATDMVQA